MHRDAEMISIGTRVITQFGSGEVVGEESFYGGRLWRALVRLDDPSKWAFGNETDIAAFFEREIATLDCDHSPKESNHGIT
jgi:hypothetical protein